MATVTRTFSVRNGIDVANTIIVSNTSGIINVSNIQLMNTVNLNVSANISNTGNLLVTQNTLTGNLSVTQNVVAGNINVSNINVTFNIANTGNLSVTQNIATGNIAVTANISAGNISTTGAVTIGGNLIVTGNTITINAASVQTNDQYIILASNNETADILDYGFAACAKNTTQGNVYSGLIKHVADETWRLFDGYALMNAYPSTLNTAQTNVATLNANIIAQQITLNSINVQSNLYQAANTASIWVNGAKVQDDSNIMFVNGVSANFAGSTNGASQVNISVTANANAVTGLLTTANVSNIVFVYSAGGATIDTRLPVGSGGAVNAFISGTSVVQAIDNVNFINSMSALLTVTQNASETHAINVTPSVNTTLNLTSLNTSANIANAGNVLVTQNIGVGNIAVTQNISTGNLSVITLINTSSVNVQTGSLTVNALTITTNSVTLATVSQTPLDNFASTGVYATAKYLVQANCQSSFYCTELLVVTDGVNTYLDEYGTILTGGPVGTITAAIATGNVQLLFTANNATSTVVRTMRLGIAV